MTGSHALFNATSAFTAPHPQGGLRKGFGNPPSLNRFVDHGLQRRLSNRSASGLLSLTKAMEAISARSIRQPN